MNIRIRALCSGISLLAVSSAIAQVPLLPDAEDRADAIPKPVDFAILLAALLAQQAAHRVSRRKTREYDLAACRRAGHAGMHLEDVFAYWSGRSRSAPDGYPDLKNATHPESSDVQSLGWPTLPGMEQPGFSAGRALTARSGRQRSLLGPEGDPMTESFCFDELPYLPKSANTGEFDPEEKMEIESLRKNHPELRRWGDVAVFMAWREYCEFVLEIWKNHSSRSDEFLDYLCWQQTRGEWQQGNPRTLLEAVRTVWKPVSPTEIPESLLTARHS